MLETTQVVSQTKFKARVFSYAEYKGKKYYAVAVPWDVVNTFIGKPLKVSIQLPSGKSVDLVGVSIGKVSTRVGIKIPNKMSDMFDGVKEVEVTVKAMKLVEEA